ncbi:MAG: metal-dependent hydrolase [Chloroflexota bacterium]
MKRILCALVIALALLTTQSWAQSERGELLWLGQSAIKLTTPGGKVIVIDPYLTKNPKTPEQYRNLDNLGKVDLVLVTHAHGDHLGDAPEIVKKNNAPLWAPQGLSASLASLGVVPQKLANRMGQGGSIMPFGPSGVKITMVHAEHNSELVWNNPATGKNEVHFGGEPCGYIIQLENGFKIYHMGDTGLFGDMKLIGDYYKPDLILIPIGGGQFVMNPEDAAYATRNFLKPKYALPIHYATNPSLVGTPQEYMKALGKSSTKVFPLNPGDKIEVEKVQRGGFRLSEAK